MKKWAKIVLGIGGAAFGGLSIVGAIVGYRDAKRLEKEVEELTLETDRAIKEAQETRRKALQSLTKEHDRQMEENLEKLKDQLKKREKERLEKWKSQLENRERTF